jgi:hypothetical protein
MARENDIVLEVEEAVAASARRYAPSIPTRLASRKQKKYECAVTPGTNA